MEGLMQSLQSLPQFAEWTLRRAMSYTARHIGWDGILCVGAALTIALLVVMNHSATDRRFEQAAAIAAAAAISRAPPAELPRVDHLERFERTLLKHDDIPVALDELFSLAEAEGLSLAKGEYRLQLDEAGHFIRYRIALPVQGNAVALQRFIERALVTFPFLAFDAVQLKREKIQSNRVDVQLQWTFMTALPTGASAERGVP